MSERKLIYVDDLEKALLDADCDVCDIQNDYDYSWGFSRDSLEEIIKIVPTVDAAPVVHGHWLDFSDKYDKGLDLRCSVCKERASKFVGGSEDWWDSCKPNYCPNCGAKMDGVSE